MIAGEKGFILMSCKDFESAVHDDNYFAKMDLLARAAKLNKPWNRNTESFIYEICHKDFKGANKNVLHGGVQIEEAINIAKILGANYIPPKRNSNDLLYEIVNNRLSEFMCTACASNATDYFVRYPNSKTGILIKRAIDGDNDAKAILSNDSSWAIPKH